MEMMPVGCDLNELNVQKEQCHQILDQLLEKEKVRSMHFTVVVLLKLDY